MVVGGCAKVGKLECFAKVVDIHSHVVKKHCSAMCVCARVRACVHVCTLVSPFVRVSLSPHSLGDRELGLSVTPLLALH
jgi:hypothetical protein